MAGEKDVNQVNSEVLSGIKGVPAGSPLSTSDFNNFVPADLSPDQKQLFIQKQKISENPATGPLNVHDYYPGVNTPINVGNYGGSEVGNLTLFAPGGNLVPIAMMDARDAAVQHAALMKAKEIDDFKTKYQAPTTKHSSVQKELDKTYFNGLQQWVDNAKKKYGQNWAGALENDVTFQKWNKAAQTTAQQEDFIVNKFADIQHQVNSGKFVSTPELTQAMGDFNAGLHGLGQSPFNPEGHKLNEYWARLNAEHDFANVANEYVDKAVKEKTAKAGVDPSNPDYLKIVESTKERFTPETLKAMAQSMQQTHFPNMKVEDVEKRLTSMYGASRETRGVSVHNTKEGGENDHYTNNDFSNEPTSINTKIKATAGGTDRQGSIDATDGLTFKKPIKVQIPVGQRVHFTDQGLVPSKIIGNKDVELGKMVIVDVLNKPGDPLDGTPLTKDQLEEGVMVDGKRVKINPSMTRKESMVVGRYEENKKEKSFMVPTKDVENSLVKKWGKDKKVEVGVPVDESYSRVEQYNLKKAETLVGEKAGKKYKAPNGYSYSTEELKKAGWSDEDIKGLKAE